MIRVTIVSPNHALRVGLREMLNGHSNIHVVGEAVNLESVNENETEVVLAASVSSVSLQDGKKDYAILFLTDDVEAARSLLNSKVQTWGVLSADATQPQTVDILDVDIVQARRVEGCNVPDPSETPLNGGDLRDHHIFVRHRAAPLKCFLRSPGGNTSDRRTRLKCGQKNPRRHLGANAEQLPISEPAFLSPARRY